MFMTKHLCQQFTHALVDAHERSTPRNGTNSVSKHLAVNNIMFVIEQMA